MPAQAKGSLNVTIFAVHPPGIHRRAGNAIALSEPFQEIAVLAAAAAEGRVLDRLRFPAERTGF